MITQGTSEEFFAPVGIGSFTLSEGGTEVFFDLPTAAPFDPNSISGLTHWWKADNLASLFTDDSGTVAVTANNDPIGRWVSSVGTGYAHCGTALQKPLYKTGILNSKPVIRFDDVDDLLVFVGTTVSQPDTVFVAFQVNETGSWNPFASSQYLYGDTLSAPNMYANGGFAVGSGISQSTPYVFACRFNGASSKANRSDSGTTYTGTVGAEGFTSGSQQFGADTGSRRGVDVAELLVYNSSLSGANVDLVGAYLSSKYGLSWTGGAT